jgi:hypothetical protein
MPFSFPASPAIGATSTQNGRQYAWTGYAWELVSSSDDPRWDYFKPAAPTGVTATASNAQAVVSWTAPAVVVPPLADYSVQFSTNGGSTWTTASDAVSTATSATITGLTNGTAYVFRVAGINGIGTGAYSTQSAAVTPTAGDPFFSSVSLLLPMDTAFTDLSSTPKTVTNSGGSISTAQKKNGAGSGLFNSSGGTDVLTISHNAGFSFQAGDSFTIECWYYPTSFGSYNYLISKGLGGFQREWALGVTGSTVNWYRQTGGNDVAFSANATVTLNQWTHIAAVCNGSTVTLYKDGVSVGATAWDTPQGSEQPLWIMQFLDFRNISHEGRGYIDNIRITKGVGGARYTANFTPPAAAFPDSA